MQLLDDPHGLGPLGGESSDELDGDEDMAGASAPPGSRLGTLHHRVRAACTDRDHVR
jgi:hypothetical protein